MNSSLANEVLGRLCRAAGQALSGQALARDLGVTRAAIWKGVEALRSQGYPVESLPSRGYRLVGPLQGVRPAELATALNTRRLGREVRHFESVDSSNREAERWAAEGAPEGALVVAEHQNAGRGRLGRSWHDQPGQSLLFSLVLRPAVAAARAPVITFAAAVALADTLNTWLPAELVEIKWPNDVLVGGRKVAGILLEMRAEGQQVEHLIVGVGINVGGESREFPREIRDTGTTLAEQADARPTRLVVLSGFLERFEDLYDGFLEHGSDTIVVPWNRWFRMAGRRITVHTPTGPVSGVARGLGEGGALQVETAAENLTEIYAGDVEWSTTRDSDPT